MAAVWMFSTSTKQIFQDYFHPVFSFKKPNMYFSNVQEKMRAFGESGNRMGNFKIVMFLTEVPTSSRDGMDLKKKEKNKHSNL